MISVIDDLFTEVLERRVGTRKHKQLVTCS